MEDGCPWCVLLVTRGRDLHAAHVTFGTGRTQRLTPWHWGVGVRGVETHRNDTASALPRCPRTAEVHPKQVRRADGLLLPDAEGAVASNAAVIATLGAMLELSGATGLDQQKVSGHTFRVIGAQHLAATAWRSVSLCYLQGGSPQS
eukprot:1719184-Amphidinium_carterae.1